VTEVIAMPTRSEVHQAIKTVAEGVMESLRILLVILMHCLDSPLTEEVNSEDLSCNQLVNEVQSQKQHIEALARMLQQPRPNSMGTSYASGRGGSVERYSLSPTSAQILEEEEWELEMVERSIEEFNRGGPQQNNPSQAARTVKSPPRRSRNMTMPSTAMGSASATRPTPTVEAGSNGGHAHEGVEENHQQIMLANSTIEAWGQKRVSWGRKHLQSKFVDVFETDPDYLIWLKARAKTHTPPMTDFLSYCHTREVMEARAREIVTQR